MVRNKRQVFTRRQAGQYFVSLDCSSWGKVSRQVFPRILLDQGKVYDLYRGFKPSGLDDVDEGGLVTNMPGRL